MIQGLDRIVEPLRRIHGLDKIARPARLGCGTISRQQGGLRVAGFAGDMETKRMEALQRVKLAGYEFVISELEVELDYLRRAQRYLEE